MLKKVRLIDKTIPQTDACLDKEDTKLFYELYFALIDFTNKNIKIECNNNDLPNYSLVRLFYVKIFIKKLVSSLKIINY